MALDVTFACDSTNQNLTINVSNPGGKYKLLGANNLGMGSPNSLGGSDYNFSILIQNAGSGYPDPISFTSQNIIPGKNVQCDNSSSDQISVLVIEYSAADSGNTRVKKHVKAKVS